MGATISQLMILFAFILCGFVIGRIKHIPREKSSIISVLLVNVFLPAKIFLNFSKQCTVSYFTKSYPTLFVSTALLLLLVFVSWLMSKLLTKQEYERKVYRYSFAISNYAYLGYVFVENTLGEAALTDMILFCIPFAFYTYTFGYSLLSNKPKSWKNMITPMTVAIALGMVFGMCAIPIPAVFSKMFEFASGCVGPLSMIVTGLVIASFTLKELLPDLKTVMFSLIRLLAIPAFLLGICFLCELLFPLPSAVYPAVIIMGCMPCGLNTIVFPEAYGGNPQTGASMAMISHTLCVVTIPLMYSLMTLIFGTPFAA